MDEEGVFGHPSCVQYSLTFNASHICYAIKSNSLEAKFAYLSSIWGNASYDTIVTKNYSIQTANICVRGYIIGLAIGNNRNPEPSLWKRCILYWRLVGYSQSFWRRHGSFSVRKRSNMHFLLTINECKVFLLKAQWANQHHSDISSLYNVLYQKLC